jgi:predicted nuclease of predicted toxin-antitoxin system
MRLLADMHISPRTVQHLRSLGHDVVRVNEILPATPSDEMILATAVQERRVVLTQDLDFSALIVTTGARAPSLISLRLSTSRIETVNSVLQKVLPVVEQDVQEGSIVTVEDERIRRRRLPVA